MSHAVQAIPSIAWVLEKQAEKASAPITPYGAWLKLRQPLCAAVELTDKALSVAADESMAVYNSAYAARNAARIALKEFDHINMKPQAAKTWKDVGQNDPLLQAIFGT